MPATTACFKNVIMGFNCAAAKRDTFLGRLFTLSVNSILSGSPKLHMVQFVSELDGCDTLCP